MPDPAREIFAGWVLKTGDIVQVMMIQSLFQGSKRIFDVGKINHPAGLFCHRTLHAHLYAKGMAVKAGTLMPCRNMRQAVGSFYLKNLEDLHGSRILAQGLASSYCRWRAFC